MFLLKFLFIIILAGLFIVLFFLFGVISLVSKAHRQFKGQNGETKNNNRQTKNNGQPVTDTRDPEQTRRKIIPDDEGEYVEYEEM